MKYDPETHKRSWWILLLRGVAAVLFGVLALVMPGVTILALTLILGVWMMADGVIEMGYAFASHRYWRVLLGLLGIAVGIFAVADPQVAAFLLILSIAAWMIVHGVLDVTEAIRLRKQLIDEWVLVLGGLVSIVLGVLLAAFPGAGGNVIIGILGAYAVIYGGLTIVDAFRIRAIGRSLPNAAHHGHSA
jgi:uncharacterized membrane protein HdeD (DUF308 family)